MIFQKMQGDYLPCIFDLLDIKSYKKIIAEIFKFCLTQYMPLFYPVELPLFQGKIPFKNFLKKLKKLC